MKNAVLVYDSNCLLCSKSVHVVLKYDTEKHILFSTLDSNYSKTHLFSDETVSVVTPDGKVLTQHKAVRYLIEHLPKLRWLRFFFMLTPHFLQKWVYVFISKNRKRLFRSHVCLLPQQLAERFIT